MAFFFLLSKIHRHDKLKHRKNTIIHLIVEAILFIRVKNVKFAFVPPSAESESSFFYRFNQNKLVYNKLQIPPLEARLAIGIP